MCSGFPRDLLTSFFANPSGMLTFAQVWSLAFSLLFEEFHAPNVDFFHDFSFRNFQHVLEIIGTVIE